jgi:hypothetical protein
MQTSTTSWTERLLEEVNAFDENLYTPPGEVARGERVIGECSVFARKVFSLSRHYQRELKLLSVNKEFAGEDGLAEIQQMLIYSSTYEALRAILWAEIRDSNKLWDTKLTSIGIRKGWKVVADEEDNNLVAHIISMLRGGE